MALNSGITRDGKEMGRAQIFQAEAAGIEPDVRMNPVLLKPTSDRKSGYSDGESRAKYGCGGVSPLQTSVESYDP